MIEILIRKKKHYEKTISKTRGVGTCALHWRYCPDSGLCAGCKGRIALRSEKPKKQSLRAKQSLRPKKALCESLRTE